MQPVFGGVPVAVVVTLTLVAAHGSDGSRPRRKRAGFPDVSAEQLPSSQPDGISTTFSTRGFVDLTGEYFQAQGTNGRSCSTCHTPQDAWSINPGTIGRLFAQTNGTHPIFNPLDANNPDADLSTVEARRAGYSMLLTRGVFRRGGAPQRRARVGHHRCRRSARLRECLDGSSSGDAPCRRSTSMSAARPSTGMAATPSARISSQGSPTRPHAT